MVHLFTESSDLFLRYRLLPLHLVKGAVCPLHDEFLHTVALRMTGRARYADVGAVHDALTLDIVGALHTGDNFDNDDGLPVDFLYCDVRGDLWFAAIENGVGNRVHLLKDFLFGKPGDSPCAVLHAEDQLAALAISKGHHSLHVFLAFGGNLALELHIFRFTGENLFCGHLDHLLLSNQISISTAIYLRCHIPNTGNGFLLVFIMNGLIIIRIGSAGWTAICSYTCLLPLHQYFFCVPATRAVNAFIRIIGQRDISIIVSFNLSCNIRCCLQFFDLFLELVILIYQIKYLLLCLNQLSYKRNIVRLLRNGNAILNCFIPSQNHSPQIFARTAYFFPSLAVWIFS